MLRSGCGTHKICMSHFYSCSLDLAGEGKWLIEIFGM